MDPTSRLRKSYKKDGVTLRVADLTKAEQGTLVSQLFTTEPRDWEYATKKYLAQIMCKRQRESGMVPDVNIRRIAEEGD